MIQKKLLPVLSIILFMLLLMSSLQLLKAQNVIKGTVRNSITNEELPAVSVLIKNSSEGTYTDDRGRFLITTQQKLPLTLVISSIGLDSKELKIESVATALNISL